MTPRGRSPPRQNLAAEPNDLASIVTISMPMTLLVVRPVFEAVHPARILGDIPPIVQAIWLDGSGA